MIKISSSFLSIEKLLSAHEIRIELVKEIINILTQGLKRFNVIWNPKVFQEALLNGNVSPALLKKLDMLIKTAVTMNWEIPSSLVEEIDRVVEDIESFNPAFRKSIGSKSPGKIMISSRINADRRK